MHSETLNTAGITFYFVKKKEQASGSQVTEWWQVCYK